MDNHANLLDLRVETREEHHTIFGFNTHNKIAAKAIDIIYWIIIGVALCFAYHSLSIILATWNWLLIFLVSLGVVGLPYCLKIILFGRKEFGLKSALLCTALSILPATFDFAGIYAETGLIDSLKESKSRIIQQLNMFEAESKKAVQTEEQAIREEEQESNERLESEQNKTLLESTRKLNEANQRVIDEKQGVRAEYSTGKIGDGPRAKELQAEVRRLQSELDINKDGMNKALEIKKVKISSMINDKIKKIKETNKQLESGILDIKTKVSDANSFKDLEILTIKANALVSSIASKSNAEFKAVRIEESDNIFKLAFGALLRLDITATVCFFIAFVMEMVDILIVFVIRNDFKQKRTKQEPLHRVHREKPVLFTKIYNDFPVEKQHKSYSNY
jgi:hypothetical protein